MSEMREIIKGVVKDHRIPNDYKFHFNQPMHSYSWVKAAKRFLTTRFIMKQNVNFPIYLMLFVGLPYIVINTVYRYWRSGHISATLQGQA